MLAYSRIRRLRAPGFTLIEVVVALAILAMSLGAIYQSFSWSLHRSARLKLREEAWLTAQSILSEVAIDPAARAGHREGTTDAGFSWQTDVLRRPTHVDGAGSRMGVYDVTVLIRWGTRASQQISLSGVELGRVNAT